MLLEDLILGDDLIDLPGELGQPAFEEHISNLLGFHQYRLEHGHRFGGFLIVRVGADEGVNVRLEGRTEFNCLVGPVDEALDRLSQFGRIGFGQFCVGVDVVRLQIFFEVVDLLFETFVSSGKFLGFQAGVDIGHVPAGQIVVIGHCLGSPVQVWFQDTILSEFAPGKTTDPASAGPGIC